MIANHHYKKVKTLLGYKSINIKIEKLEKLEKLKLKLKLIFIPFIKFR